MTQLLTSSRSMFRGWWVVSGAMIAQGLQSALFFGAFGIYAPFWMAEFGWSRTTISLIHSLQRTESGLLGPVNGWLISRFGPNRMIMVGMTLMGLSMIALGFTTGFATFLAAFLVMAIGASFAGILSMMTILVNWFERRRATAMALAGLGMSIGSLTAPLLASLLVTYGWRGVTIGSGILFLVLMIPLGRILINEPESVGLRPDGDPHPASKQAVAERGVEREAVATDEAKAPAFKAREVLRSRAFWLMSIGHSNALAIVSAVGVHFVIFAQEIIGISVTAGATLLMIMTICSMVGQGAGGVLGDRLDKRLVAGSGMLLHAGAMVALTFMPTYTGALLAAIMHGVAWGIRGPLMSALRADYFGRAAFAMVMGFSSLIVTVGSVLGPLTVGLLADSTGGYAWGFGALAVVGLIGALAFFVLENPPKREAVVVAS
ncbi:MAG: MFS transporter [Trueperaceae bacterium]